MHTQRIKELSDAMQVELAKYEKIRAYFSTHHTLKNHLETAEVCEKLQESAKVLNVFREEYQELMQEVQKGLPV